MLEGGGRRGASNASFHTILAACPSRAYLRRYLLEMSCVRAVELRSATDPKLRTAGHFFPVKVQCNAMDEMLLETANSRTAQ